MSRFLNLTKRFQDLATHFGCSKSSSFSVKLEIANRNSDVEGQFYLSLGTYDIGDMPRTSEFGPYKTIEMVCQVFETVVMGAESIKRKEILDTKNGINSEEYTHE